jgi:AcrR family transcriptional regulator
MTSNRDTYHHGDLRAELLTIARAEVEASGHESLSVRACARAAGVDVAATYRHFKNKDALLAAIAWQGFEELGDRMHEGVEAARDDAREAFIATGVAYAGYGLSHPHLYRLMFTRGYTPELVAALETPRAHDPYALLNQAIDALGLPAHAREGAERIAWAVMHGMVSLAIDGRGDALEPGAQAAMARRCAEFTLRGLGV